MDAKTFFVIYMVWRENDKKLNQTKGTKDAQYVYAKL